VPSFVRPIVERNLHKYGEVLGGTGQAKYGVRACRTFRMGSNWGNNRNFTNLISSFVKWHVLK